MGFSAGARAKATACGETEAGSVAEIQVGTEGLVSRFGRCASVTVAMLEESFCDVCLFMDTPAFSLRRAVAAGPYEIQR